MRIAKCFITFMSIFSLSMLLAIPGTAIADEYIIDDKYTIEYTVVGEDCVRIDKFSATLTEGNTLHEFIIPDKIGNLIVTEIGDEAFPFIQTDTVLVESVYTYIPNTIKKIGVNAFSNTIVNIVYGGTPTEWVALVANTAENNNWIYNSITYQAGDFHYDIQSENAIIVKYIGDTAITSLEIPRSLGGYSVSGIESHKAVFPSQMSLQTITIPKECTLIGAHTFYYCSDLKEVYYGGSKTEWESVDIGAFNTPLLNATIYYAGGTGVTGDIDGNDTVNMRDALALYQSLSGRSALSDAAAAISDVNNDGTINMRDVLMLYQTATVTA